MKPATQAAFGDHVGISRQAAGDLVRRGILPEGGTLDQWRLAYCRHLREQAAGRQAANAGSLDLVEERARLTHHQANIAALEEDVKRGHLIPAEVVEQTWSDLVYAARAHLLGLPTKAAAQVLAAGGRAEVEAILKAFVNDALAQLSEETPHGSDRTHQGEHAEALGPAAEPDGERVGEPEPAPKRRGQRRARPVQ